MDALGETPNRINGLPANVRNCVEADIVFSKTMAVPSVPSTATVCFAPEAGVCDFREGRAGDVECPVGLSV